MPCRRIVGTWRTALMLYGRMSLLGVPQLSQDPKSLVSFLLPALRFLHQALHMCAVLSLWQLLQQAGCVQQGLGILHWEAGEQFFGTGKLAISCVGKPPGFCDMPSTFPVTQLMTTVAFAVLRRNQMVAGSRCCGQGHSLQSNGSVVFVGIY